MRWLVTDLDYTLIYPIKHKNDHFDGNARVVFQRTNNPHRGMVLPCALRDFVLAGSDKRVAISARPFSDITKLDIGFMWDYIICAHGSEIYQSGTQIADFTTTGSRSMMEDIYNILQRESVCDTKKAVPARIDLIRTHGGNQAAAFVEIKLQSPADADSFVREFEIAALTADPDIAFEQNGRTLTIKPVSIDKAHALSYLIENHISVVDKAPFLMGAGDSNSDIPFMKLCHIAIAPTHSQIIQQTR